MRAAEKGGRVILSKARDQLKENIEEGGAWLENFGEATKKEERVKKE